MERKEGVFEERQKGEELYYRKEGGNKFTDLSLLRTFIQNQRICSRVSEPFVEVLCDRDAA